MHGIVSTYRQPEKWEGLVFQSVEAEQESPSIGSRQLRKSIAASSCLADWIGSRMATDGVG